MSFLSSVFRERKSACVANTSTAYLKYSRSLIYYHADVSVTSASSDSQLDFQPGQHSAVTLCLVRDLSFDATLPPVQSAGCLPPLFYCGCGNSGPIPDPLEAWGTPTPPRADSPLGRGPDRLQGVMHGPTEQSSQLIWKHTVEDHEDTWLICLGEIISAACSGQFQYGFGILGGK